MIHARIGGRAPPVREVSRIAGTSQGGHRGGINALGGCIVAYPAGNILRSRPLTRHPPLHAAILILIFRVVGGADEAILVRQVESGNGLRIELEVGS
jgi:hypothetical protein